MDKEESPTESDSEEADQERALAEKEKVSASWNILKWKKNKNKITQLYHQGNAFFKEGKYDDAIECYSRGMAADPYNPVLPTNRAAAFYRLKK